jgi:hypothetical protein
LNRNRTLAGYLLLAGALVMAILAALFYTEVFAGAGAARDMLSLVLGAVAVSDAAIGIVLIVKS